MTFIEMGRLPDTDWSLVLEVIVEKDYDKAKMLRHMKLDRALVTHETALAMSSVPCHKVRLPER